MSERPEDFEREVVTAVERVVASGQVNLRDRMTVARLCRDNGDDAVSDWIFDNPQLYSRLIGRGDVAGGDRTG